MTLAETIQNHVQTLSPGLQREALDFIEFLEQRYQREVDKQDDTEAFLAAVAGSLSDDFPNDVCEADLGLDAPRQDLD